MGIRYSTGIVYLCTNFFFYISKTRGKIIVVDTKLFNEVETATLVIKLTFPLHMNVNSNHDSFVSTKSDKRPFL